MAIDESVPVTALEQVEAETMYMFESGAPSPVREALGITTTRIAGGVALAMRHDVTGYWNKALGFGVDAPVTRQVVGDVVAFFRDHDAPEAVVQIAPTALPASWPDLCAEHGFVAVRAWVKLAGRVDEVLERTGALLRERPGLGAEPAASDEVDEWGRVTVRGFGMPEQHLGPMTAALTGVPGVAALQVRAEGRIVGAATLRVDGPVGHLFAAAVLPEARRRGAQTALLHARARAARDAGCRWLVAETEAPISGDDVPSLRNMLRAGMRVCYERANWHWTPATHAA